MKKVLLGTSAIALASAFATSANAAEWEMKVGGYMTQFVAFADSDVNGFTGDDFAGVDSKSDAEISFVPSITLDNGLQIGVNVQLEAAGFTGTADTIDEQYMFIKGSFGEINLGSENSAGYKMHYASPNVGAAMNSGTLNNFIPFSGVNTNDNNGDGDTTDAGEARTAGADLFRRTLGATRLENVGNNDANRITYYTPRFAGFQLGVSYARDGNQDTTAQLNLNGNTLNNIFDIGANYVNSFGGIDVAISGRYGIASNDAAGANDPEIWSAGANLGFAGVTIGGSFAEQNNGGATDGIAYDAGISYATGPWSFSFSYFHGESVNNENATALQNDEELDQFQLAARYALAKGVSVAAFGAYVDFDEEVDDTGAAGGDDVDGFVIGTSIDVSF